MSAQYQVIAECAHVVVTEPGQVSAMRLFYKGAFLPAEAEPTRLKHLLDHDIIAVVGDEPIAPNAAVDGLVLDAPSGVSPDASTVVAAATLEQGSVTQSAESPAGDGETDARRAEARAKLAEIGGVPDGRSSDAVMVEYLVRNGYDRAEVERADRAGLKGLVATVK